MAKKALSKLINISKTNNNIKKEDTILEYSIEKSKELGKRTLPEKKFNRPAEIVHKIEWPKIGSLISMQKTKSKAFAKMVEDKKSKLERLYEKEDFKEETFLAFVDKMENTTVELIDSSAVFKIDLDKTYNIAGEFILINLTKVGEEIKINQILKYI